MGGSEIGSAFLNGGGILGLDVVPSEVRSVLILGGRRGPDIPGGSHDVCPGRAAGVVCGSSRGWVGRGSGSSAGCIVDKVEILGTLKVHAGMGCVALGGELDGRGRTGGEGFSGTNAGALGFNRTLEGKEAVPVRGGWMGGDDRTALESGRVDGASDRVTGGIGCTIGGEGKNESGV